MTMGYSIDADFREMVGIFFDGQMRDSGKKELCLKTFVRPVRLRLLFHIYKSITIGYNSYYSYISRSKTN